MRFVFILVILSAVGYGVYSVTSSGSGTDILKYDGQTYTVQDKDTASYFTYSVQKPGTIRGEFFKYGEGSGTVEHLGRVLVLIYLDGAGYSTFLSDYGGDIQKCPAPFLNTHTKTVHLFAANEQIAEELSAGVYKINPGQESAGFEIRGKYLSFFEAELANGRSIEPDFAGQPLFLVEEVVSI